MGSAEAAAPLLKIAAIASDKGRGNLVNRRHPDGPDSGAFRMRGARLRIGLFVDGVADVVGPMLGVVSSDVGDCWRREP
jgi:hypothetical protein